MAEQEPPQEFLTMGELRQLAERKLDHNVWDYTMGGAASETTLRRNSQALERLAIEQRVLVDVREIDLTVEFLGLSVPSPVIVAPMGGIVRFWPEGDLEMARGAGRAGNFSTVSGVCGWPMEQIAAAATGPLIFQLYHFGDRDWVVSRLERVQSRPEYKAICLTVDSAVYSRRDRDVANRYFARERSTLEPPPPDNSYPARLTWADVDWLRQLIHVPFGLKGIMSAADARIALDHGIDFIWVSNHGGRQLDSGRATIDALPEIVDAVAGRAPVLVDGGFTRGADVIKAVALGATMVAMGKACAWGLAVGGADGIASTLRILRDEIAITMGLSGNTSLRALRRDVVRKVAY